MKTPFRQKVINSLLTTTRVLNGAAEGMAMSYEHGESLNPLASSSAQVDNHEVIQQLADQNDGASEVLPSARVIGMWVIRDPDGDGPVHDPYDIYLLPMTIPPTIVAESRQDMKSYIHKVVAASEGMISRHEAAQVDGD